MIDLWKYVAEIFEPKPNLQVWEWCEQNIVSVPMAEDSAPYSTLLYPYVREILNCFQYRSVEDCVLIWGSQCAKTTTFAAGAMWSVVNDPLDMMWGMDTGKNAEKFSKDRLTKLIEATPAVKARLGGSRGDDNVMEKRFDEMNLYLIGSNSPGNLASNPAGRTIGDEIDKWPGAKTKEAAAVKLLESRTKGKAIFQRFWSSTPTTEDGASWARFINSDQRFYMMPCPNCGTPFKFETKGVIYDSSAKDSEGNYDLEQVEKSAYYRTPCGCKIDDSTKLRIMREAYDRRDEGFAWQPTNSKNARPKSRGYHLNSLYSPMITFGRYAVEWVLSKSSAVDQQNFKNSWEALPWKDRIIEVKPSQIRKVESDYDRGDLRGKVRVLMIDIQRNDFRFNARGYGPKSSLIDWGICSAWSDIDDLQARYNAEHVGIDVQFPDRQQEAFKEIFEHRDKGWFAIEGKGKGQIGRIYHAQKINPFVGERKKFVSSGSKILHLQINSEVWKAELARKRNAEGPEWEVYRDIEGGYTKELYAEFQRMVLRRGREVKEWFTKAHGQNHQFDLETYHLAFAHYMKFKPYDHGSVRTIFQGKQDPPRQQQDEQDGKVSASAPVSLFQPVT
ncbi:MAG: terminase gpA endonuclease subunit [Verrucomicrobiota bacterium]